MTELLAKLSEREKQVLAQVGAGRSNKDIAIQLGVSLKTIKWHFNNIYKKTGLKTDRQLIVLYWSYYVEEKEKDHKTRLETMSEHYKQKYSNLGEVGDSSVQSA